MFELTSLKTQLVSLNYLNYKTVCDYKYLIKNIQTKLVFKKHKTLNLCILNFIFFHSRINKVLS